MNIDDIDDRKDGIHENLEPIKCSCGSTQFNDITKDTINGQVCEFERYCAKCGVCLGYWSYGFWMP